MTSSFPADCILLLDKPFGITSFDVVSLVKRACATKRVGHSGTLDKSATGLIVAATGRATRLTRFFLESDKRYSAVFKLGVETDTLDLDGEIVSQNGFAGVSEDSVRRAMAELTGSYMQYPPLFSALKVNGQRASDRVRKGEEVRLEPRSICVYSADILEVDMRQGTVSADIFCSKGTYIRSMAHDLGKKLGCGAVLSSLRRTRSGSFSVENAVDPRNLPSEMEKGGGFIVSMEDAVAGMSTVIFNDADCVRVLNGLRIDAGRALEINHHATAEYAIFNQAKKLIAIADITKENGTMRYLCVFN